MISKDSFLWDVFTPSYHSKCLLNSDRGPGVNILKFLDEESALDIKIHKGIKANCEYHYIIEGGYRWKETVNDAILSMKDDGKQYYEEVLSLYDRSKHLLIMIIEDDVYHTRIVSKELKDGKVEYVL